ncbi:MAG: hypothetical protein H6R21_2493 [Proteobacteria bacterium]|nr:hypothetical protein [Pseudomonadota bacterium]
MATYLIFGTLAHASRLPDINFRAAPAAGIDAFDTLAAA